MTRVAVAVFFVATGVILCVSGAVTLLPALTRPFPTFCAHEFSLRLIWPSVLIIAVLLAYVTRVGRIFFWQSCESLTRTFT
jgi:hypothetical protein